MIRKKPAKVVITLGIVLATSLALIYALQEPTQSFKINAKIIATGRAHEVYGLNTMDNHISSQDIIDLIYWCHDNVRHSSPISYEWCDRLGGGGFSLVWQDQTCYTAVTAFYANDNDSIVMRRGEGQFSDNTRMMDLSLCDIDTINWVIDKNRIP